MDQAALITPIAPAGEARPLPRFEAVTPAELQAATAEQLDLLPFGVIGLDAEGTAVAYNATESRLAGLRPERVLGRPFFQAIGVCMNNHLVAQRFVDEPELDAIIPYILTFRMRYTPVRLRLLRHPGAGWRFLLIDR